MNTRILAFAAGAMLASNGAMAQSCMTGSANVCTTTVGAVSSGPSCNKALDISPPWVDPAGGLSSNVLVVPKPTDPVMANIVRPGATISYQVGWGTFVDNCKAGGGAPQLLPFISYAE